MSLTTIKPNSDAQREMLDCLDDIRQKVMGNGVRALLITVIPIDPHGDIQLEQLGDIQDVEKLSKYKITSSSIAREVIYVATIPREALDLYAYDNGYLCIDDLMRVHPEYKDIEAVKVKVENKSDIPLGGST